jgi:hypothetical protein
MVQYVIDNEGRVWTAGSRELHRHFGYPQPDFDLVDYAVRNFGCIHVRMHGTAMRIRLSPGAIGQKAVAATARMMIDDPCDRYVFEFGMTSPYLEIVSNLNDALARLEAFRDVVELRCGSIVVGEELSLGRLRHPKRRQLRDLIKEWKSRRGFLTRDLLAPFQAPGLVGRTIMTRIARGGARVEYFGPRLDVYEPGWSLSVVGRYLCEQPDPEYGESSARGYEEVALAERPRLELVDAVIRTPGRRPLRSRYERLLLPWKAADGATFVSGASVVRTRFSVGIDR